jgi:hypothetical protein
MMVVPVAVLHRPILVAVAALVAGLGRAIQVRAVVLALVMVAPAMLVREARAVREWHLGSLTLVPQEQNTPPQATTVEPQAQAAAAAAT